MTNKTAAQYWDDNATTWTTLARLGYDTYRDFLNTPAFIITLPDDETVHAHPELQVAQVVAYFLHIRCRK